MAERKETITVTQKELKEMIRKEFNLEENFEIQWVLKDLPHGRYDDFRDPPGQTVSSAIITVKKIV